MTLLSRDCTESKDQLKSSYRTFLLDSECSERTIENYGLYIDRFLDTRWGAFKEAKSIEDLKLQMREFINELSSVSAKRLAVTAFKHFAKHLGLDADRFKVRVPKIAKSGVKHLTPEQVCAILEEAKSMDSLFYSARNPAILAIFAFLGLRLSELHGLKPGDIDFEHKRIRVLGKGNKIGYVPIIKAVIPYLEWWLQIRNSYSPCEYLWITESGRRLSKRAIQYIVTGYVKQFDNRLSTHSLRHTAATTLINSGVDLKTVSTLLRHSNFNTTADIYAHKSVEAVGEDMDKVYGG